MMDASAIRSEQLTALLRAVKALEKKRGSRIWCMIHAGPGNHICHQSRYAVFDGRGTMGRGKKLEVLLHSPGGHPHIAYLAMKFFRARFDQVNALVPLSAKSAATLMCLGADEIFMGEMAELGPIDIQLDDPIQHGGQSFSPLNEFKSLEFLRDQALEWMEYYAILMNRRYGLSVKEALKDSIPLVTGLMRPILEKVDPLKMGGHRRDLAIAEEYATRMLSLTGNSDVRRIVRRLVWEYPSHDFYIDRGEALAIGLPVKKLPEVDDLQLAELVSNLDNDDSYEGFSDTQDERTEVAAVVSAEAATNRKHSKKRPNGSEENGAEGRSRTAGALLRNS